MKEKSVEELVSLGFSEKLLSWYRKNRRILPWREEPTPYHVWISEIMLQQTRVEAVKGYYERFLERLPDVGSLATADDEELHKLWEGLGYYNRAKNLKKAAIRIEEEFGGELPSSYEELLELPGIGPYTAGAIASIAFHEPVPAVDGNVMRVVARLLGDDGDIGEASTKKRMEETVRKLLVKKEVRNFNQALMELGALVCVPNGRPKCEVCPVKMFCFASINEKQGELPVKKGKKERRKEKRTVLIFESKEGEFFLRKRGSKGLLSGLWEFPSLEGHFSRKKIEERLLKVGFTFEHPIKLEKEKHIFSHIEWDMTGYFILLKGEKKPSLKEFFCEKINDKEEVSLLVAEEREYENIKEVWADFFEIKEKYSIPSAFGSFLRWVEKNRI